MEKLKKIFETCEKTGSWYGEKINDVKQKNFMGDTVLHTVCSWGDVDAVKALLDAGADVNAIGDQGVTPLFNAVIGKNVDVVSLLIKQGADPNKTNDYNRNILDYANNISAPADIIRVIEKSIKKKK